VANHWRRGGGGGLSVPCCRRGWPPSIGPTREEGLCATVSRHAVEPPGSPTRGRRGRAARTSRACHADTEEPRRRRGCAAQDRVSGAAHEPVNWGVPVAAAPLPAISGRRSIRRPGCPGRRRGHAPTNCCGAVNRLLWGLRPSPAPTRWHHNRRKGRSNSQRCDVIQCTVPGRVAAIALPRTANTAPCQMTY